MGIRRRQPWTLTDTIMQMQSVQKAVVDSMLAQISVGIPSAKIIDLTASKITAGTITAQDITLLGTAESQVKAEGILTLAVQPTDGDTYTIDTKTYTFQTTLTNVDGHVAIGGSLAQAQANLKSALDLSGTAGVDYATAMTAHTTVDSNGAWGDTATNELVLTAKTAGSTGNTIATTETFTSTSNFFDDTTLGAHTAGSGDGIILETNLGGAQIRSSNYQSFLSGFLIDSDGNAEFNSIVLRGEISGSQNALQIGGTGSIQSTNFVTGSTGWSLNGDGSLEASNAIFRNLIIVGVDPGNQIRNPGFDASTTNYEPHQIWYNDDFDATYSVATGQGRDSGNSNALRVDTTGIGNITRFNLNGDELAGPEQHVPALEGQVFHGEAFVKSASATAANRTRLVIGFFDFTGALVTTETLGSWITPSTGSYEYMAIEATAPVGAAYAVMSLETEDTGNTEKVAYWDDCYLAYQLDGGSYIKNATITSAKIISLVASKITAGTISAQEIILSNSASSILRSANYSAGTAGWRILGNGNAEFNNVTVRGTINADTGYLDTLNVTGVLTLTSAGGRIQTTAATGYHARLSYNAGLGLYNGGTQIGYINPSAGNDFLIATNPGYDISLVPSGPGPGIIYLGGVVDLASNKMYFSGDPDVYITSPTTDQIALYTGGNQELLLGNTGFLVPNVYSSTATTRNVNVNSDGRLGTTSSAKRMKRNIKAAPELADIELLPISYRWRKKWVDYGLPDGEKLGLLADPLAEQDERLGHYDDDGQIADYDDRGVLAVIVAKLNRLEGIVLGGDPIPTR